MAWMEISRQTLNCFSTDWNKAFTSGCFSASFFCLSHNDNLCVGLGSIPVGLAIGVVLPLLGLQPATKCYRGGITYLGLGRAPVLLGLLHGIPGFRPSRQQRQNCRLDTTREPLYAVILSTPSISTFATSPSVATANHDQETQVERLRSNQHRLRRSAEGHGRPG